MAFDRDGSRRWFMRLHGAEDKFDATSIALRGTTFAAGGVHRAGTGHGRTWRVTTAA